MKQTIKINEIEEAVSSKGKEYWKIKTNEGTLTLFERNIYDKIKGKKYAVLEVVESNGFKNVRQFYGYSPVLNDVDNSKILTEEVKNIVYNRTPDKFADARTEKNKSFWVAYAKDLIVSGMKTDEAIKTINKLREEL
tara:strand:+ start:456 stop:866 length:411 start_codon:yes stop_codon:yes gene_type:complete